MSLHLSRKLSLIGQGVKTCCKQSFLHCRIPFSPLARVVLLGIILTPSHAFVSVCYVDAQERRRDLNIPSDSEQPQILREELLHGWAERKFIFSFAALGSPVSFFIYRASLMEGRE